MQEVFGESNFAGIVYFGTTSLQSAYRRALERNPNYANAHYFYAYSTLVPEKRIDQALQEYKTALTLDPLPPIRKLNSTVVLTMARRYPESLAQFDQGIESNPTFSRISL